MDDFYKNLMYNIKDINTILTGEPEDDERILQGRRLHSEAWTGNFGQGIKNDTEKSWSVLTIPMMRQCISLRTSLQWCRRLISFRRWWKILISLDKLQPPTH